mgnify:CR=1 FL=1
MDGSEGWRVVLREARRRLGITRQELAERAGLSPDTIRAYELGRRRPRRDHLELIVRTLNIPNAEANQLREDLGFAPLRTLFTGELDAHYYFTAAETEQAVEEYPWPSFVVNDAVEVVAANRAVAAVWDVDWTAERRRRPRAQRNLLAVAIDLRFAERVLNWDEVVGTLISVFKAKEPSYALDASNAYFQDVMHEFSTGDPAFLSRMLEIWNKTDGRESRCHWTYPVTWHDAGCGDMRFLAMVSTASEPDALAFNDWIPVDAGSWRVLEAVKGRHSDGR